MKSSTLLIAGASGYLGTAVTKAALKQGFRVKAIVRDKTRFEQKLSGVDRQNLATLEIDILDPEQVSGVCKDIDFIFSSLGITRQRGFSYDEVDFGGNYNLLLDAQKHNVKKFIYTSVLNPHIFKKNAMVKAKEKFVRALQDSSIDHCILRPTGFFSDIAAVFQMAVQGTVYIPGNGESRINPIHGDDLAQAVLQSFEQTAAEVNIGGPQVFTQNEIAKLAFEVLDKKPRIVHIPAWAARVFAFIFRLVSRQIYSVIDFIITGARHDMSTTTYGGRSLRQFFEGLNR